MAFTKVLIANRGEIAVRVIRSAKALGYRTVAVYSTADKHALHVQVADEAVCIGAPTVADSYLNATKILDAARLTGADAIHPGYGFLSENADFARACLDAHIVFIGPPPDAMALMGSKRLSKIAMLKAGVPCVPGYEGSDQQQATLLAEGVRIGFPLMVKASAGGGGRGMRLVAHESELATALDTARSEALNAFGSGELILERAVIAPRHVEIQVFGDTHQNYVYLFERDCSIQRRHQKVVEEAPCPVMTSDLRQKMGEAAVAAARSCGYVGAGTVEFLLDAQGNFYFLEMNTRLQVEHPVTELITGLDLVEWQLRVAQGEVLPKAQHELTLTGHAIEVRLYAEDPAINFLPQTGHIVLWQPPTLDNVRVDHGIHAEDDVSPYYDPMIAKVIAYGATRADAVRSLTRALQDTVLLGLNSNKQFLVNVLSHPVLMSGDTNTAFITEHFADDASLKPALISHEHLAIATALRVFKQNQHSHALATPMCLRLQAGEQVYTVAARQTGSELSLSIEETVSSIDILSLSQNSLSYIWQGVRKQIIFVHRDDCIYLNAGHGNLLIEDMTYAPPQAASVVGDGDIKAPMNGAVVNIMVAEGEQVDIGQTVLILEAMKIQQQIKANCAGVIGSIGVSVGQQVKTRQSLLAITPMH